ncbi:MAG: Mov34/MPN/PAD-1 family protein [Chitinophagales bacterium]
MKKVTKTEIPRMRICESAFNEIINFIASKPAESGGALFGSEDDYIIRKFVPDTHATTSRSTYTINTDYLNPVIKKLWNEEQLSLIGIIHSHPQGYSSLSGPDLQYFGDLLGSIKRRNFFAPIVFTIPDGGFKIFPHLLDADGKTCGPVPLEIIPDSDPVQTFKSPSIKSGLIPRFKVFTYTIPELLRNVVKIEAMLLAILTMAYAGWFVISVTPHVIQFIIKIFKPWS